MRSIRYVMTLVLAILLFTITACQPESATSTSMSVSTTTMPTLLSSTPTQSPTAITPTATPSPTATPMPTPSPTPIPTWTILFSGFPCEDQECWPDPSTTSSYYAIYSDGTGLEQVAEFPLDVPVPGDHRSPGEFNVPQLSPDGSMVAYIVENQRTIDLVETATGEPYEAFGTWVNIGLNNTVFGSVCWDPGGVVLKYSVQYIGKEKETEFHVIDYDKTHAPGERPLLFTLPVGLWIWTADCSPNGLEMAFSVTNSDPEIAGLYVVNLNTGEWRKILPHYFITKIRTGTTSIAP